MYYHLLSQCHCCPHIETSQLICTANQLTGFYMRATLTLNGLREKLKCCGQTMGFFFYQYFYFAGGYRTRLWHKCFFTDFVKYFRSAFLQKPSGWLFLKFYNKLICKKWEISTIKKITSHYFSHNFFNFVIFFFKTYSLISIT